MSAIRKLADRLFYVVGKQIEHGRRRHTHQQYREKYAISPTFALDGPGIVLCGDGKITLQEGSYIGAYSHIESSPKGDITVGKNCAIGYFAVMNAIGKLPDQDFSKTIIWQERTMKIIEGNITIGDDCWIGAFVHINPRITIGNNAIIGAHSVVTRDIPPHSIAAGVPAKVIKFKSYIDEKDMLELAKRYWPSLSTKLKEQLIQKYGASMLGKSSSL